MIKNLINNPKYNSILVRVISSFIFLVLFVLVCVVFEFAYRGSVTNQINKLIHNILFFGI
jgi:sensor histidine kinase YesM